MYRVNPNKVSTGLDFYLYNEVIYICIYVCVFPVWVPLRPPVDRFVRPSVWWSAFVRPFVWVVPPPPVGRFLFSFPATFILCHLSVVRRLCCGALAQYRHIYMWI